MERKKMIGAWLAGIFVSCYYLFLLVLVLYEIFNSGVFSPVVFILFLIAFGLPLFGICFALRERIREIKSGEEAEARKY